MHNIQLLIKMVLVLILSAYCLTDVTALYSASEDRYHARCPEHNRIFSDNIIETKNATSAVDCAALCTTDDACETWAFDAGSCIFMSGCEKEVCSTDPGIQSPSMSAYCKEKCQNGGKYNL